MDLFHSLPRREADESRLREVCESFIGPPTGMGESTSSGTQSLAWDPCVLVSSLSTLPTTQDRSVC